MSKNGYINGMDRNCYAAPCEVEPKQCRDVSIGSQCLKELAAAQERLNNISLNMRDKLEPICLQDHPAPVDCEKNVQYYPPLFNEMREFTRRLNETADRLESLYERCEL